MSSSLIEAYSRYSLEALQSRRPDLDQLPKTFGGFVIMVRRGPKGPEVLLKERPDGRRDLPGGGLGPEASNQDLPFVAVERAQREVKVRCRVIAAIGEPLYGVFRKGEIDVLDTAQAFLVEYTGEPSTTDQARNLVWVRDVKSFCRLDNVVGHDRSDPKKPILGRMPLMFLTGLSAAQQPFRRVALTEEMRRLVVGDLRNDKFSLFDRGNYLALPGWGSDGAPYLALYHQLVPYKKKRRRVGLLD